MKATILLALFLLVRLSAYGACSLPAGGEGQLSWSTADSKIKWCQGTNWVDPVIGVGVSCTGFSPGHIQYDSGDLRFCDGTFWQSMKGSVLDTCFGNGSGTIIWDSARHLMKFCDGVNWNLMYTPAVPVMSSFSVNGGAPTTRLGNLLVSLSASSTDGVSKITHFCLKHNSTGVAPATPANSDSCWIPVNNPSPGITPSTNVSFSGFYYSIGFTPATYTLFAWVKNGANLITSLSAAGNGTAGFDKASISYDPGAAPILINVFATRTDAPSLPPTTSDLLISAGNDVYIKWKLTDDEALPGSPVDIYYTTDEINYTLIASGITNDGKGDCSVDGTTFTGCYRWSGGAPTSSYFKVRVQATDATSLSSIQSAEPNNMSPFKVLAGTTDPGLGGSAKSAVVFPTYRSTYSQSGSQNFIVRENGMMFIVDDRGLLKIDPVDGNLKLFLPYTGVATDGALSSATLIARPLKLALDYQDRLLIYDSNRVRRVNFSTGQISTIIGGGAQTADGTPALDFSISPIVNLPYAALFVPLPNGDIWFQTQLDHYVARNSGSKIRIYKASDEKVYVWTPSGIGSKENATWDPSTYAIYNFGISYNPVTSAVTRVRSRSVVPISGGHTPYSVSYDPATGVTLPNPTTTHVPFLGYWTDDATINSRNGEMYAVDRFERHGIYKYDPGINDWVRVVGNAVRGQCPDGTPALSCAVEVSDAFINNQNQIFFVDRNRIRTVDADGNVLTIFGQSLAFGDGGFAASARLNDVYYLDLSSGGKVVFADNNESVFREFTPGSTITRIAGNGVSGLATTAGLATAEPIAVNYWGGVMPFATNPADGTIYFSRDLYNVAKLDRSTGKWVDIAGGGPTHYASADGLPGNQIAFLGYPGSALAFNGTSILRPYIDWNGTDHNHSYLKTISVTDGTQSALAGIGSYSTDSNSCADGTPLTSCATGTVFNFYSKAQWDAGNARWLIHQMNYGNVRTMTPGGNWGTLVNTGRSMQAFTYVERSGIPYLYFCSNGRAYKYNISTSTETALPWPSSSVACTGHSIIWHATRLSVIFPIRQNGIGAIAEIADP